MEENSRSHKILLTDRGLAKFTGVVDVLSFDETMIELETEQGALTIKGNDLHVTRLTLENGEIDVDGRVDSLVYSDGKKQMSKAGSVLGRLFG